MREIGVGRSVIRLERGEITALGRHIGAIVNPANVDMRPSTGVCGAIFDAGGPVLVSECLWHGKLEVGRAVATTAGQLPADCVIHAVGPVWQGGTRGEDRLLASAYRNSLEIATEKGLRSIAFPPISTGSYGYSLERAAAIAIGTTAAYLKRGSAIDEVILVVHSDHEYLAYDTAVDRWRQLQEARAAQAQSVR